MGFFLIGRGPDDDLRLLSPKPLESRQDAMAELSRLSADPRSTSGMPRSASWTFSAGVPVLLVRSAAAAAVSPEAVVDGGGYADAWVADLPPSRPSRPRRSPPAPRRPSLRGRRR